jgi:hypothetical protein
MWWCLPHIQFKYENELLYSETYAETTASNLVGKVRDTYT